MSDPDLLDNVLAVALRAGELLLRHGAETWRIEDTVQRLLHSLGAVEGDVVATPTSIVASAGNGAQSRTRVRRVRAGGLNLAVVDAVNSLSREAVQGQWGVAQVAARLDQIERGPPLYRDLALVASAPLTSAGFTLLFGGGLAELLAALPGALLLGWVQVRLLRSPLPALLTPLVASWVGAVAGALLLRALPVPRPDIVILSTVVSLVPGAAIVLSIGDLLGGHLLAGLARGAAAALVAAAIAAGVVAALRLTGLTL